MAKKKVKLTDDQKRRNDEILRRLEEERKRLWDDTRTLQRRWNEGKRVKRRSSAV